MAWTASSTSSSALVSRMPNRDPGSRQPHGCPSYTCQLPVQPPPCTAVQGHRGSTAGLDGGKRCVPGQQEWRKSRVLSRSTAPELIQKPGGVWGRVAAGARAEVSGLGLPIAGAGQNAVQGEASTLHRLPPTALRNTDGQDSEPGPWVSNPHSPLTIQLCAWGQLATLLRASSSHHSK